jgi:ABC-type multidrug transport system fused ATPase/permease subunit
VRQYTGIYDFEDRDMKQLDAVVEILNEEPTIGIHGGVVPSEAEAKDTTIEFRDVAFARSTWPMYLERVSFTVPAGSFVAVCGKCRPCVRTRVCVHACV